MPSAREADPTMVSGLAKPDRRWEQLNIAHVLQADTGVDLDFLVGRSGSAVGRESH